MYHRTKARPSPSTGRQGPCRQSFTPHSWPSLKNNACFTGTFLKQLDICIWKWGVELCTYSLMCLRYIVITSLHCVHTYSKPQMSPQITMHHDSSRQLLVKLHIKTPCLCCVVMVVLVVWLYFSHHLKMSVFRILSRPFCATHWVAN